MVKSLKLWVRSGKSMANEGRDFAEPVLATGSASEMSGDDAVARQRSFRALYDSAPSAILVEDLEGKVLDVNPAGCLLHRMSRDELIGSKIMDLAPQESRGEALESFEQLRNGDTDHVESVFYTGSGEPVPVSVRVSHFSYFGEPALLLHVTDVTQQRELEEQLRKSQKMEAIGRLAGGIAHDFNNSLTAILGYTELCQAALAPGDAMRDDLVRIQRAGEDAATLVSKLLAFSRQQVLEPRVLSMNDVVSNVAELCRRTIGEDVRLVTRPRSNLNRVKIDQGQFEQVILNLAVNSRDAMPDGGEILIATENITLDRDEVTEEVVIPAGRYVSLTVADTGCGIDEEVRSQIFDPFFSTKAEEKGTGLGLSTVYGIVKQSGGFIVVDSEKGKGTTVRILVPATADQVRERPLRSDVPDPTHDVTILLTEDNEIVRELSRTVLEDKGYRVLVAESAEEALLTWSQNREVINLLLTDVILTGLDGLTMTRKILEQRPGTRALLMTGHSREARFNPNALIDGVSVLRKPFTPAGLEKAVARALR
jgi:two-component system cell cycle sensor histidine kinase/response regulator CckA